MTFTKKLSALAIAGTMAITGASIATVPAVAADKSSSPGHCHRPVETHHRVHHQH